MTQAISMQPLLARSDAPAIHRHRWHAAWLLGCLCALTACLQLVFYTGSIASDDLTYLDVATANERPTGPTVHLYARVLFWNLLRASAAMFGRSEMALVAVSMCVNTGLLVLVWAFAKLHLPQSRGWSAAWALALSPMFVLYGTICTSDLPAGLFALAGVTFCAGPLLARETSTRRPVLCSLVGGCLIGMGFSFKEPALLAGPGLAMFVLLFRLRQGWAWRRLTAAGIGAVGFLAIEATLLWCLTGDPLFHFHMIAQGLKEYGVRPGPGEIIAYLTDYVRWLADPNGPYGWWGMACVGSFAACVRGGDAVRLIGCVIFVTLAYMSAGSVDLFDYFPVYHQPRYLLVLFPFFAILIGDAMHRVAATGRQGRWVVGLLVLALAAQGLRLADYNAGRYYSALTYNAGKKLFDPVNERWIREARFIASPTTEFRLSFLADGAGLAPIAIIQEPPGTRAAWLECHAGAHVLISREDRAARRRNEGVLAGSGGAALKTFPVVAAYSADKSRIRRIGAVIGLCEPALDDSVGIDVIHLVESEPLQAAADRFR